MSIYNFGTIIWEHLLYHTMFLLHNSYFMDSTHFDLILFYSSPSKDNFKFVLKSLLTPPNNIKKTLIQLQKDLPYV